MAQTREYRAYVDGSVFDGGKNSGIGWVVYNENSGKCLTRGSRRLDKCGRGTTTLTEIYAAAAALDAMPAGATVILHSDDQDLCHVLQRGEIERRIDKNKRKPALQEAYKNLFNAVSRHTQVRAIKMHINDSALFRAAHDLARIGAYQEPTPARRGDTAPAMTGTSTHTTTAPRDCRERRDAPPTPPVQ